MFNGKVAGQGKSLEGCFLGKKKNKPSVCFSVYFYIESKRSCLPSEGSSRAWWVSGGAAALAGRACQGCSGICFLLIMGKITRDISVHAQHS